MRIKCSDLLKLTEGCEYLDVELIPEWQPISVKCTLAEVLACTESGDIFFGFPLSDNWNELCDTDEDKVTHWMPLPAPPKSAEVAE